MNIIERQSLANELIHFIDYIDCDSIQYNYVKAKKELNDIKSRDLSNIKGASKIIKSLTKDFKKHNPNTIMLANRLVLLIRPTMTVSNVNKVLNYIKQHLTSANLSQSMSNLENAFSSSTWFSWIDDTFHQYNIQSGEEWPWVLRHAVNGDMKPKEYAKLYPKLQCSYPYYKAYDPNDGSIYDSYTLAEPITVSDFKEVIEDMKHSVKANV